MEPENPYQSPQTRGKMSTGAFRVNLPLVGPLLSVSAISLTIAGGIASASIVVEDSWWYSVWIGLSAGVGVICGGWSFHLYRRTIEKAES